jgi:hypothetical protein
MKYAIGYPIWNKADMMSWYMEGIHTNMRHYPEQVTVIFSFADCTDDSVAQFQRYSKNCLPEFRVLPPLIINRAPGAFWVSESEQHNVLLKAFMEDGKCDALLVPQDDMKFNGNENCAEFCKRPILNHLDSLFNHFGQQLGCITGRDTYYNHFTEAAGSWWSASDLKYRLGPGEFKRGYVVNRGPILYPRHLVKKIGFLDIEHLKNGFAEVEFAARAHHAGFINGAMGMDILHVKFGRWLGHGDGFYEQQGKSIEALLQRYPDTSPW